MKPFRKVKPEDSGTSTSIPSLSTSVIFETTAANLLDSVDELLSGRAAPDLTKAPRDTDVFSPVSKRTPPPRDISHPHPHPLHHPLHHHQVKREETIIPPFSLPDRDDDDIKLHSNNRHDDLASASDAFLFAGTEVIPSRSPWLQQSKRHSSTPTQTSSSKSATTPAPTSIRVTPKQTSSSKSVTTPAPPSSIQIPTSRQSRTPSPPPVPTPTSAKGWTQASGRSRAQVQSSPKTTAIATTAWTQSSTQATQEKEEVQEKAVTEQPVKLGKEGIEELTMVLQETLKAELEDNLTDLRNDILNIHSEMVVMASRHSEELRKVVVDRDEGLAKLKEENDRLRADNERLRRKYGLL